MKKTKHPYLKEILKTTTKVALIVGATAVATPYAFGFLAGFTNLLPAGYAAGVLTAGIGAYTAIKTALTDAFTMRARVKQKQREEYINAQLEELRKKLEEQNQTRHLTHKKQPQMIEYKPEKVTKKAKKVTQHKTNVMPKMRSIKQYNPAA